MMGAPIQGQDHAVCDEARFEVGTRLSGAPVFSFTSVPANTASFIVNDLTTGASSDFVVRACDAFGCWNLSNQVTVNVGYQRLTASSGGGTITSQPTGITCGLGATDCSEFYTPNTVVKLTANPYINPRNTIEYDFEHWEGSCTGQLSSTCTLTMSSAKSAKGVFVRVDGGV